MNYIDFEVYRKRGRGWQYLGEYYAEDSNKAARAAGYVHNCKVLGVRPAGTNINLVVYRFLYIPFITG